MFQLPEQCVSVVNTSDYVKWISLPFSNRVYFKKHIYCYACKYVNSDVSKSKQTLFHWNTVMFWSLKSNALIFLCLSLSYSEAAPCLHTFSRENCKAVYFSLLKKNKKKWRNWKKWRKKSMQHYSTQDYYEIGLIKHYNPSSFNNLLIQLIGSPINDSLI